MDENNYERNGERDLASVLEQKEYLHVAYSKERLTSGSVPQPLLAHLGKCRSSTNTSFLAPPRTCTKKLLEVAENTEVAINLTKLTPNLSHSSALGSHGQLLLQVGGLW